MYFGFSEYHYFKSSSFSKSNQALHQDGKQFQIYDSQINLKLIMIKASCVQITCF